MALVVGCSFQGGVVGSDGTVMHDARIVDTPDAGPCLSWDAVDVDPCSVAIGSPSPLDIAPGSYTLDTDAGTLAGAPLPGAVVAQTSTGPTVRVVNATELSIAAGAVVTVIGSRALVIVVHEDATISGTLDGSAIVLGSLGTPGPGGDDPTQCTLGTGALGLPTIVGMGGGGGGAGGGAYGGNGGNGGNGNGGGGGQHGVHGTANGPVTIQPLRGGCAGGAGGADGVPNAGGRPGHGGGAIEITARGTITIVGAIHAGGSGGGAGPVGRGGGGAGGAGGAILLDGETTTVQATAALCANGGGGGEGAQNGMTSGDGQPGTCSTTVLALGGAIQADGGDGGNGTTLGHLDGTDGKDGGASAGAGGGGGGTGRIRVRGRTTQSIAPGAAVTPPATP